MPKDSPDWTRTTSQPSRPLATFTAPPNATTTRTVTLQPGCFCIGILLNSLSNVTAVTVTGNVTGIAYSVNVTAGTGFGTLYFVPVLSAYDTSVVVGVQMGLGGQTATVYVAEILSPEIVAIYQSGLLSVDVSSSFSRVVGKVEITDGTGTPIVDIATGGSGAHRLAVYQPDPLPWQAPRAFADLGRNAAGTVNMVAQSGTQHIYVFGWSLSMDGAQGGTLAFLQDQSGNHFAELSLNGNANALSTVNGFEGGLDLGASAKVDLNVTALPAGSRVIAKLGYTQA